MSKGVKNPFSSNQNEMNPIEEDVKDDIPDISMIETPRMDVSGIKLESA